MVPGFGGQQADAIKKDVTVVTARLAAARKAGKVPPDVLSTLTNIARRAKDLKDRATVYRAQVLHDCLMEK